MYLTTTKIKKPTTYSNPVLITMRNLINMFKIYLLKQLFTENKKYLLKQALNLQRHEIYAVLVALFFTSCGEWEGEYDFRNYLRDKHPYSEIKETKLGTWTFQVNDTLQNEIWIYTSYRSESSVKAHCVNCN